MIQNNQQFSFLENRKFIFYLLIVYVIVELIYGFWNNSTWDDDCPSRYYNTLNAIHDFKQFVSLWNRPLFVMIFFLPVQISKYSILILMVAISTTSAYYLYKGVQKTQAENAWLVIPLMLFQLFYFGVSRNGEVEPLAVAIICLGYYFYTTDRIFWFAIAGSLLPLARLELSPALLVWILILIQKKNYKYILLILLPTLVWSIAGGISEGHFNIFWLVDQVLKGENSENIYGHQTFGHYFQSYPYVLGPVIFFLFFIGLAERLYKKKIDLFIVFQFIIIFFIYVIFSWKLNTGNAAGFLRNLIPLTPLAALLSLNGFNLLAGLSWNKKTPSAVKPISNVTQPIHSGSKHKQKKIGKSNSEIRKSNSLISDRSQNIRFGFYILILITLFYYFFSWEIKDRNSLSDERDFTNLLVLLSVIAIYFIIRFIFRNDRGKFQFYFSIITALWCIGFALVMDHPGKYINSERRLQEEFSDLYESSYLKNYKTYANHIWFYWCNDLNKNDTAKYGLVTKENLSKAPFSSIVFWENHYSNRLGGDVEYDWLKNNREFIDLYSRVDKDRKTEVHIFQKVNGAKDSIIKCYDTFIRYAGNKSSTFVSRGKLLFERYLSYEEALRDFDKAIEIDSTLPEGYVQRGVYYFNYKQDFVQALRDFTRAGENDTLNIETIYNKGLCFGNMNRLDEAIQTYSLIISKDSTYKYAYLKRATVYYSRNEFQLAIQDYSKILQYEPENIQAVTNRGISFFKIKDFQNAIGDFSYAIQLNPNDFTLKYFRANSYYSTGNYKEAVEDYNASINANPNVAQLYYDRGLNLFALSDFRNACNDFQRALSLGYPVPQSILNQCKLSAAF